MRHRLSRAEMAKGVRSALRSTKTPKHLRSPLRKRLRELEVGDSRSTHVKRARKRTGFLGWLDF